MMSNDIRSTLTISAQEAANGAVRPIFLPNGQQTTVSVPAGSTEGQILQYPLPDQTGMLFLTLHIAEGQGTPPPPPGDMVPLPGAPSAPVPYETRTVPSGPSIPGYHAEMPPPPSTAGAWSSQETIPPPPPPSSGAGWPQQYNAAPSPEQQQPVNAYASTPQPGQPYYQPASPRKGGISSRIILLIVLAVVIIIGASTLFVFANNSAQQSAHSNQTATADTSTKNAGSTATGVVNATQTAQSDAATAVAQATNTVRESNPNPYGAGGILTLYDKLDGSSKNTWINSSECAFTDGSYHETSSKIGFIYFCSLTNAPNGSVTFNDFTLEVKVTVLKGDVGGVKFHSVGNNGYVLTLDSKGYSRMMMYKDGSTQPKILWEGNTSTIKQGYGQANTVGIVTKGSTITWYINSQRVSSVTDSSYTSGGIDMIGGLYSNSTNKSSDVSFNSLRIWSL